MAIEVTVNDLIDKLNKWEAYAIHDPGKFGGEAATRSEFLMAAITFARQKRKELMKNGSDEEKATRIEEARKSFQSIREEIIARQGEVDRDWED